MTSVSLLPTLSRVKFRNKEPNWRGRGNPAANQELSHLFAPKHSPGTTLYSLTVR